MAILSFTLCSFLYILKAVESSLGSFFTSLDLIVDLIDAKKLLVSPVSQPAVTIAAHKKPGEKDLFKYHKTELTAIKEIKLPTKPAFVLRLFSSSESI